MKPKSHRILLIVLSIALINAGYLSWRYLLVNEEPDLIGSSLCSFTDTIDCDKVLSTPQARAFYTPNAILGFGFLLGCLIWSQLSFRLPASFWRPAMLVLRAMLLLGAGFTMIFWYLLLNLEVFCVLCPLNHISIYLALFFTQRSLTKLPKTGTRISKTPLVKLAVLCLGIFFLFQWVWVYTLDQGIWSLKAVWAF